MFANTFQSGFISIFYSVGSSPLQLWDKQVKNGHIRRIVDEEVRSLVLEISGTNVATTYITCPIKPRLSLGIKLPFLVMIVKNMKKYFTFEIQILDDKDMHRRFRVSNFQSTTKVRPFCTTMPIGLSSGWNQVQFNLADFTKRAYGSTYMETTRVQIHANVRIRRIYFSDMLYSDEDLPNEYKLFVPTSGTAVARKGSKEKKEKGPPSKEKKEIKKPSIEIPPPEQEPPSAAPPSPSEPEEPPPPTTPTETETFVDAISELPTSKEGESTTEDATELSSPVFTERETEQSAEGQVEEIPPTEGQAEENPPAKTQPETESPPVTEGEPAPEPAGEVPEGVVQSEQLAPDEVGGGDEGAAPVEESAEAAPATTEDVPAPSAPEPPAPEPPAPEPAAPEAPATQPAEAETKEEAIEEF